MKMILNSIYKIRHNWNIMEKIYEKGVKEIFYYQVPLLNYNSKSKVLTVYNYFKLWDKKYSKNRRYGWRFGRPQRRTIKYQLNEWLPPSWECVAYKGRGGGFVIIDSEGNRHLLNCNLYLDYDGQI